MITNKKTKSLFGYNSTDVTEIVNTAIENGDIEISGGTSKAIVDVDELPTENISTSKIYRVRGKDNSKDKLFVPILLQEATRAAGVTNQWLNAAEVWGWIENEDYFLFSLKDNASYGNNYDFLMYADFVKACTAWWNGMDDPDRLEDEGTEANSDDIVIYSKVDFKIIENAEELNALKDEFLNAPIDISEEHKTYLLNNGSVYDESCYYYVKDMTNFESITGLTPLIDEGGHVCQLFYIYHETDNNLESWVNDYAEFDSESVFNALDNFWLPEDYDQSYYYIKTITTKPDTISNILEGEMNTNIAASLLLKIEDREKEAVYIRNNNSWIDLTSNIINGVNVELPEPEIETETTLISSYVTWLEAEEENVPTIIKEATHTQNHIIPDNPEDYSQMFWLDDPQFATLKKLSEVELLYEETQALAQAFPDWDVYDIDPSYQTQEFLSWSNREPSNGDSWTKGLVFGDQIYLAVFGDFIPQGNNPPFVNYEDIIKIVNNELADPADVRLLLPFALINNHIGVVEATFGLIQQIFSQDQSSLNYISGCIGGISDCFSYLQEDGKDISQLFRLITTESEIDSDVEIEELNTIKINNKIYTVSGGKDVELNYATDEDVELCFGIMNLDNRIEIDGTAIVVDNNTIIDEKEYLVDFDGENLEDRLKK